MKPLLKNLEQFLGSYFHQDLACEYSDYISATEDFLQNTSKERIIGVNHDLENLLKMKLSERDLENIVVYQLGCYLDPSYLDFTYRQLLIGLKEIIAKSMIK